MSAATLTDCASEPIRIPGAIQPNGCLLVLSPEGGAVLQASANAEAMLGCTTEQALAVLRQPIAEAGDAPIQSLVSIGGRRFYLGGFRSHQGLVLELEPLIDPDEPAEGWFLPLFRSLLEAIESVDDPILACQSAADEVRRLTGFNRALAYRFDEDWNGTVVAESNDGVLPSYLGLWFPASDIPAQARALYRVNRLRLIADVDYSPVPILPPLSPIDGQPFDLSLVGIRSVSPVHREYMRNMETAASMSLSLVIDGRLWGLISCHHATPRLVGPRRRAACDVLARLVSQQIGTRLRMRHAARQFELKRVESELLAQLTQSERFQDGLTAKPAAWIGLTDAMGAAVVTQDDVMTAGRTPSTREILSIAAWLRSRGGFRTFVTDELSREMPEAKAMVDTAAGLLAVPISQVHASFLLWFRPEHVRTVSWGGDPHKPMVEAGERLHPRRSFALWQEQVRLRSLAWEPEHVEAAQDFGSAIASLVLRHAEERAELAGELERSNRELEAFSYSVSHDLRAPFRHIAGFAELLAGELKLEGRAAHYLENIVDSARMAGRLVDDLLNFSKLNRTSLQPVRVDMRKLFDECWRSVQLLESDRTVEWRLGALPPAWGDPVLLRQVVLNLLQNSLKFTRGRARVVIEASGETRGEETIYSIRDNGVGFDMAYVDKLFGVFQRLHRVEEFEGTGIGLALAKRVIERHRGWIRAEGVLNEGATFTFGLPIPREEVGHG